MSIAGPGLLLAFVPLLFLWLLGFLALYWVVRLAVRHGTVDAWRAQRADPTGGQDPGAATSAP